MPKTRQTKNEAFQRLANQRFDKIKDDLRKLGNLSNKSNYSYSQEEVEIIFTAIDEYLSLIKAKFNYGSTENEMDSVTD